MGARENKLQKRHKYLWMKSYAWQFYLCFLNSYEIWTKKSDNYIIKSLKSVKKNVIWPKIFCYKVFVHRKLKSLNFLIDPPLILISW